MTQKHFFTCQKWLIFFLCSVLMLANSLLAETQKFHLGISAPLSGALAEYGVAVKNGIALAREQSPECSEAIHTIFEDSQYESKKAVANFHAFRRSRPADLIYFWGDPPSEAIAPLALRYRQPVIALSGNPDVGKDNSFFVRSLPTAREAGVVLARYLMKQEFLNFGIVLTENTYTEGMYAGIKSELEKASGTERKIEILNRFSYEEHDFRSTISKIKGRKIDALGVFLASGQVQSFYRQSVMQGLKLPSFGTEFLGSNDEIAASGQAIEGAVYPTSVVSPDFAERYRKAFGTDSRLSIAANAHDVMALVMQLFCPQKQHQGKSWTPEEVMQKLITAKPLSGAQQIYSYDDSAEYGRRFISPIEIRVVKDGKTQSVTWQDK